MRYFERDELTRRYNHHRPKVHAQMLREIASTRSLASFTSALDVACGTGHSTDALSELLPFVSACDISTSMLRESGVGKPGGRRVQSRSELLPFRAGSFDLLTVCMAFHWFDSGRFLDEAARVLRHAGELWVSNLYFPGVLVGEEEYLQWHTHRYSARFPAPSRHSASLTEVLATRSGRFSLRDDKSFTYNINFTSVDLRSYLTTQSNIEMALREGSSLAEVDSWLDRELAPFFTAQTTRTFLYVGRAEIAVAD